MSIAQSHLNLLTEPIHGVLTTILPDGQPQSSIVWCDYDGDHLLISTTLERQKGKNMLRNSKVSLLVIDPKDAGRWISVRGDVESISQEKAIELADKLTQMYTTKQHYYGDIFPLTQKRNETRVIVKILPKRVILDAI
ncbi:MAG: PPOX class F420-dependent oxidoreductase, partial [Candidatus Kariarchaeaceae archaeon]